MDTEFRPLNTREREILERLLQLDFRGRDELRSQLSSVAAKQIHDDGTLLLRCSSGPPAPTKYAVATEATYTDVDGGMISILLHVDKDGFMHMLEIVKYGPKAIITPPIARELVLIEPT